MSTQKHTVTLLISCPDKPGIVAAISHFIFEHSGNIVQSDQHSTPDNTFFMRISVDEEGFTLSPSALTEKFQGIADAFSMQWSVSYSRYKKRAGIFVSKLDHCLTDLLWRWKSGELALDIPFIVSNHRDLEALAQMYNVPYHYIPVQREHRVKDEQRYWNFYLGQG